MIVDLPLKASRRAIASRKIRRASSFPKIEVDRRGGCQIEIPQEVWEAWAGISPGARLNVILRIITPGNFHHGGGIGAG